ncbi:MAG: type VI secretion system tip protein VgrG, partial [Planctomycetia bacterium]|nr:type VI secretion system tip protein VgrG [Planctomycetia bacterium]
MAAKFSQANRPIKVTTPLGDDALLLEKFSGGETLSEPFRYTLDLLAEAPRTASFEALLGKSVTVTLTLADKSSRYFNGIVSSMNETGIETGADGVTLFNRYRAQVVPTLWTLTRTAQSRVFQQLSVVDILKKVLATVTADYSKLQGTYNTRDHCFQYRETDFDFASRLMEEEGIFYFFTHANGSHTMVLGDTPQAHADIAGAPSVPYWSESGEVPYDEWVDGWEKSQTIRSGKYTLWDHNFGLPDKNLQASQTTLESVAVGTVTHKLKVGGNDAYELYDYPGGYAKRYDGVAAGGGEQASELQKIFDDNTRTTGIRMQQEAVAGLVVGGTGNCRRFAAGSKFSLKGHSNADGEYALTRVEQSASLAGSYQSGQAAAFDYRTTFRCVPVALPFRPQRVTPQPRVAGAQTAVVVGPQGQEIFTDKYSRVKVQFFWDRLGANDANSSCWVRVATPWAGKQWGTYHIPRIGQEVLVDFLEGDPDRPIIIGGVYNDADMPPYTLPDNATRSGVKSRSSTEGTADDFNELRFEDKKGSEEVYFHAEKDFNRVVENNDTLKVGSDDSNTCPDGSQTTSVYKDRTETVETGDESVTVKKGKRTVTVSEGDDAHEVTQGKRTVTVNMDDTHQIKQGKRVVKVDTGDDSLTVTAGNQTVKISAGATTT